MNDPARRDDDETRREGDRPSPKDDVDRTMPTVVVPKSKRPSELALEHTPVSGPQSASSRGPISSLGPRSQRSTSQPSRPPGSLRSRAFPVVGWDKYEPVDFIGEGGMGRVYKVLDPVLKRHLALKFIRDEDDRLIRRFFQEAQAQARIDHEHVCKVYEVGEVEGLPYIAMQYIEGKSLKESTYDLTLEQKVTIIRQVASALHAAHRMGIIHRDIKPSNIMVEKKEDGSHHAYVMDFGLAREMASPGESVAGLIEGTPSYMAPEQARGDHKNIDRRADIYSLGATLYQQLTERPPFVGDSTLSILLALEKEEVTPPRQLVPSLPEDLEIIVMKCLEKDSGLRYDSAKALAEDLTRYLEGDPIAARRASLSYLLLKKIRKHKALFAVSCVGVLGIAVAAGFGVRARVLASEQAELSKHLGEDVKEMELLLRWAYALPLHDVGREKARIRDRMKEIEGRIERMGAVGRGPGHYALGRGHLALHESSLAREHLEKALLAGYGGPEVERALGRALGEVYKKELEETYRIGDKKPRDARRAEIERELLEPALRHLRSGGGEDIESEAYLEGLIAFYNKRYDEALEKARQSEERALSTYEAKKLRADVYSALGTEKKEQGKGDEALSDYDRAAEAYEAARTIARSDASVYEAECELWAQRMEIESNSGKNPKASFDKALAACDGALVANPEGGGAYGKKAWALSQLGMNLLDSGKDPTEVLSRAIQAGEQALRLEPRKANTLDTLGLAHLGLGFYEMSQAKDPRSSFRLAAENFEKAIELHPNFAWAHNDLGGVYRSLGEYEESHGIDPTASLRRAIEHREKAIQLDPQYYYPHTNIGLAYTLLAQYELRVGRDPSGSIKALIGACERSLAINKSYYVTHDALGTGYLLEAQHKLGRGEPLEGSIKLALQWFDSELSANPKSYYARLGMASANSLVVEDALRRGTDAVGALERAQEALKEAERGGGEDPQVALTKARVMLLKARVALRAAKSEKDIDAALKEADEAVASAEKVGSGLWEVFAAGGELSFWSALEARRRKGAMEDPIQRGIVSVDRGLAISPDEAALLEWKGALLLLSSRAQEGAAAEEAARQGQGLIDAALRKNPLLEREWKAADSAMNRP